MEKWVEDIQMAIDLAEKSSGPTPEFLASSPPDNSEWRGSFLGAAPKPRAPGLTVEGRHGPGLHPQPGGLSATVCV